MRPIIKWPGGKAREYESVKYLIPSNIETYIEPFFGGGGIFFNLEPERSIINDANSNLMSLYSYIKNENKNFLKLVNQIGDDWNHLSIIASAVFNDTKQFKNNINKLKMTAVIKKLNKDRKLPKLINGQENYWELLSEGLINKFNRIIDLEEKNGKFSNKDFYDQVVAVTKGAYYYYLRDKFVPKNKIEDVAQFFFIREFCFGSMFRFNNEGKFNIPYGGASYNNKSFHSKINHAFSYKTIKILKGSSIYSLDFRKLFRKINKNIDKNDFCFFDPPYDTEFSEYDKQTFGQKDQKDLAELFGKLKCRGLMIIKKTPFILDLYKKLQRGNKNIIISEYGKNYSYNVRGRNERKVKHLLVLNYKPFLYSTIRRNNMQLSFPQYL